MKCRACDNPDLHLILDLGHQPPSNALLTRSDLDEPEITYPLRLYVCPLCWLVQIPAVVPPDEMFNEGYPYYSSQSPSNVAHAKEFADMFYARFNPKRVLEIGSNDGYMLQWFAAKDIRCYGIDPSPGPADEAVRKGLPTYLGFFGGNEALNIVTDIGKFDLICSINTIAHQPDINDFMEGMKIALAPGGVITAEFPHLLHLLAQRQFDTIYHEHYNYYSLTSICSIFEAHGLEIFSVDELPTHGGSLRIYAQHKGGPHQLLASVSQVMRKEIFNDLCNVQTYEQFGKGVLELVDDLREAVFHARRDIVAYGAAAKGNTLINTCRFTERDIPLVFDRSPHKAGKFLPGSHIPILLYDRKSIEDFKPKYVLLLPWNLADEIMQELSYIREWGGKFILPIPNCEVI